MGRPDPGFLVVGHVVKSHGIRGELSVQPLTDHPEGTFAPGVVLRLADGDGREPDPDAPPLRILSSRPHREGYLLAVGGIESRNESDALRGRYLMRPVEELEPLEEGEAFYHQMLGLEVYTVDGTHLGRVTELYDLIPTDLLEVRGEGGEHLIPYRKDVVVELDLEGRRIVVDPPEGLLDL